MKNNRTNLWIFWSILVFGLWIMAGCGGNPTTPGPSDVQDFGFDDGGLPVDADMDACLAAYHVLQQNGGGATTVVNDHGYILIGAFERWSGTEIQGVRITIHENDGTASIHAVNGKIALTDLVFPIIITAYVPGHTAKTIVGTSANVIAFGLDLLGSNSREALIYGYAMGGIGQSQISNWLVVANSTHGKQWEYTHGGLFMNPYAQLWVDAERPVGAVAFLYSFTGNLGSGQQINPDDIEDFNALGYSYGHIGTIDPGSVGAWIMDLNEEGAGTDRGTANYTIAHLPADPEIPIGRLVLTPGGVIDSSEEFVPYYIPSNVDITDASGEYPLTSYDPPAAFDRDVVQVNAKYSDGSSGAALVDWNVGGSLPDIDLKDVPTCNAASLNFTDPEYQYFNADWEGPADNGYVVLAVWNRGNDKIWEIQLADGTTSLPADTIIVPSKSILNLSSTAPAATVSYITCSGFDMDDFTATNLYSTSSSWSASIPEGLVPDFSPLDGAVTPGGIGPTS